MKSWLIVIVLLLSLVLIGSLSCSPAESSAQETHQQLLEQGDLAVTISGSGNIEVANELKLTFSLVGKVDKIYVEESDEVSEGEVLAELDTDALELALNEAQATLNQAQVTSNQAQVAVAQAQADV
ncbi:biotin/lipoyl-binding protein, partial [Chloroflexota bacterium]